MKNGGQLGFNYETGGNHHIDILYDNDGVIDWILTIMIDNDDNLCQVEEIQTS